MRRSLALRPKRLNEKARYIVESQLQKYVERSIERSRIEIVLFLNKGASPKV